MNNQSTPKAVRALLNSPSRQVSFIRGIGEAFIAGVPDSGGIIEQIRFEQGTLMIQFGDFFIRKRDAPEKMEHYPHYEMSLQITRAHWHNGNLIVREDQTHTTVLLRPSAKSILDAREEEKEESE